MTTMKMDATYYRDIKAFRQSMGSLTAEQLMASFFRTLKEYMPSATYVHLGMFCAGMETGLAMAGDLKGAEILSELAPLIESRIRACRP